jgi:hypothetical protein
MEGRLRLQSESIQPHVVGVPSSRPGSHIATAHVLSDWLLAAGIQRV